MKIVLLIGLLLLTALIVTVISRRRVARAEAAAAVARMRAARRSRIPVVSNNLKGVTASQTIPAYTLASRQDDPAGDEDERAA
jgi:hypothetical protein